jgi:hypothetical protein
MSTALERHDRIVVDTVGANGGVVLKAKLEGDATVSVFRRASAGALAALALREALRQEPWPEGAARQCGAKRPSRPRSGVGAPSPLELIGREAAYQLKR